VLPGDDLVIFAQLIGHVKEVFTRTLAQANARISMSVEEFQIYVQWEPALISLALTSVNVGKAGFMIKTSLNAQMSTSAR